VVKRPTVFAGPLDLRGKGQEESKTALGFFTWIMKDEDATKVQLHFP
jgi:hypothetical protein